MTAVRSRFCLDHSTLAQLDPADENFARLLQDFAERIVECHNDGQEVVKFIELFELPVWQVIWSVEHLDRDLRLLLLATVDHCPNLPSELVAELPAVVVQHRDWERRSDAAAFAYHMRCEVSSALACICVAVSERFCGIRKVGPASGSTLEVHFICDRPGTLAFYRDVPEIENMREDEYIDHCALAFPDLYFSQKLKKQFRRFRTAYTLVRPLVSRHVAVLSDHFREIFNRFGGEPDKIMREISSAHDVDLSRDSPSERKHHGKRGMRTIRVLGEPVYCSWHTKVFPAHDRIYFAPHSPDVADGRVVVGLFAEHL